MLVSPVQMLSLKGDAAFKRYSQPWMQALLLGATSLAALSIPGDTIPASLQLWRLPLRHVELKISKAEQNFSSILVDLSFSLTIGGLKITGAGMDDLNPRYVSPALPPVCLHAVASLKHVEIHGWFPTKLSLPERCQLRMSVCCSESSEWEQRQNNVRDPVTMLTLCHGMLSSGWPSGLPAFSKLQYLKLLRTLDTTPHQAAGT